MAEGRIYVATTSGMIPLEGTPRIIRKDHTRVREGHALLKIKPEWFKPIDAHYEVEQATAAPAERRARTAKAKAS